MHWEVVYDSHLMSLNRGCGTPLCGAAAAARLPIIVSPYLLFGFNVFTNNRVTVLCSLAIKRTLTDRERQRGKYTCAARLATID